MSIPNRAALALLLAVAALDAAPARAAAFDVPGTHATVQLAVAAAAVSPDVDNTITLSVSPFTTASSIDIGVAFGPGRHLVIRPAAALARASIVNTTPGVPIINMNSAGNVTLQDLDILRNITNNNDIVFMFFCDDILIERCRIGSNWSTPGAAGWSNVRIHYPTGVVLRNNIMFARAVGTFDFGINAGSFNDPANSLRLYNNDVSDYKVYGIRIEASFPGPLVLLRNNVVVNHTALVAEPTAYRTEAVVGGPMVVTSHNVAFASAGFVESGPGGTQDIAGFPFSFLTFIKADAIASFVTRFWTMAPPWDANADFYRLAAGGPLHDTAADNGMTVGNVAPDIAVVDDIEKDARPGGAPPHTDRGADQIEDGATSGTGAIEPAQDVLRAAAHRGSGGELQLQYATREAGRLELSIVDVTGRLLHRAEREVAAESIGVFSAPAIARTSAGILFYRLTLNTIEGSERRVAGKIVAVN